MADTKCTCLRFNMSKPEYRRAWEILQKSDKSYSKTIIEALNEYDEHHSRLEDDPYFENRQREEKFVEQIVSAVEASLEKALPPFLSAFIINMIQPYGTAIQQKAVEVPESHEETSANDVDWDFLGG